MPYLEEIKKKYKLVQQNGNVSQTSVKIALQYENWQNLPRGIVSKIRNHQDYPDLAADSDKQPVPDTSQLDQECQMRRSSERINLAYSLCRPRPSVSSPLFDTLDTEDFPKFWELLEKGKNKSEKEQDKRWVTTDRLTLRSEQDLHELVCRLGLYPWREMLPGISVFCLELSGIDCVKPNALDEGLAFYFHQTPNPPGRTRNLETGQPDMEEWLCSGVNHDSIQCVGGCFTQTQPEINMNNYFDNCAKRIQGKVRVKGNKLL